MVLQQDHRPWLFPLLEANYECTKGGNPLNSFCIQCRGDGAIPKSVGESHRVELGHTVVVVLKASGHYALEISTLVDTLKFDESELADIHVFSINGHRILYLNSRQVHHQEGKSNTTQKGKKLGVPCCTVCQWPHRTEQPNAVFCSLGCKYRGKNQGSVPIPRMEHPIQAPIQIPIPRKLVLVIDSKKRKNMTATDNHKDDGVGQLERKRNNQGSVLRIEQSENIPTQTQLQVPIPCTRRRSIKRKAITKTITGFRKRSRKGVPHRSPLK